MGLVALLIPGSRSAPPGDPERIDWVKGLDEALARARNENRPLLAYFRCDP